MREEMEKLWEVANPMWLFRTHPSDMGPGGCSVDRGYYYLPGQSFLIVLHLGCVYLWAHAFGKGHDRHHAPLYLLPILFVWLIFVLADVKFRLQRPTEQERAIFHGTVMNWVGCLSMPLWILTEVAAIIAGLFALIRHLFS
jgi:hypothetical protein